MAWTKTSVANKGILLLEETYTLPSSATTEYTTEIDDMWPNGEANRYIQVTFNASAVSGTNLDIALYGAATTGGTKYLLLDAVVADITATGTVAASVDLNAYPAPYYYFAWTSDIDESSNTIDVKVIIPRSNV